MKKDMPEVGDILSVQASRVNLDHHGYNVRVVAYRDRSLPGPRKVIMDYKGDRKLSKGEPVEVEITEIREDAYSCKGKIVNVPTKEPTGEGFTDLLDNKNDLLGGQI